MSPVYTRALPNNSLERSRPQRAFSSFSEVLGRSARSRYAALILKEDELSFNGQDAARFRINPMTCPIPTGTMEKQ